MAEIEEQKKAKPKTMDFVSQIDFFSTETSFNFEGEDNFKTMCGGALSLLIMIVCLAVTVTDPSYYSNTIRMAELLDESPYTVDNKLFNMGITLVNVTAGNVTIPIDKNWTVAFSCVEVDSLGASISVKSYPTVRNCELGDHCISDDFTCDVYRKSSGEYKGIQVGINLCNIDDPTVCNGTALDNDYGMSATSTYQILLNVTRYRPSDQVPDWVHTVSQKGMAFSLATAGSWGSSNFRREEFTTNTKVQGALGLPSATLVRYNPVDKIPIELQYGFSFANTANMSVMTYVYIPDVRYNTYIQQFTDLSGMLSQYFAISGIVLVIYAILFTHYAENMMFVAVAQHLHYIIGPDKRPINFSESNIKTIITCILYFRGLGCCFPSCLKPHVTMIQIGRSKLNLNNMMNDLQIINAQENGKNPLIKLHLDDEEEDEEEGKVEEIEAAIADFVRTSINQNAISVKEIEIFIEWVKLNHYNIEEAKEVALRLFTKRVSTDDVFAENEARQYQAFKESMKENECDDLYLVASGPNDSSSVSLNQQEKEKEKEQQKPVEFNKTIKIKGDKDTGFRESLQVNNESPPKVNSTKELAKLVIKTNGKLIEMENEPEHNDMVAIDLAESNMRVNQDKGGRTEQ